MRWTPGSPNVEDLPGRGPVHVEAAQKSPQAPEMVAKARPFFVTNLYSKRERIPLKGSFKAGLGRALSARFLGPTFVGLSEFL